MKALRPLRIKLIGGFVLVTACLSAFLLISSFYAIRIVRNQVSASYSNMAALYQAQTDLALSNVEKYLGMTVAYNNYLYAIQYDNSAEDRHIAEVALVNQMGNDIVIYPVVDSLFAYIPESDVFLSVNNNAYSYAERTRVRSALKDGVANNSLERKSWQVYLWDGNHYLVRIVDLNGAYMGAWIKVANLENPMSLISFDGEVYTYYSTDDGTTFAHAPEVQARTRSTDAEKARAGYQLVSQRSRKAGLSLNVLIPDKNILNHLPAIRTFSWILLLVSLLVIIPYSYILIQKSTLTPLKLLTRSMKKVKNGDYSTRITLAPTSSEFETVYETFNSMAFQIQTLQSDVAQEHSIAQAEELQKLQMQQNPHFLINSLNILYNLLKTRNQPLAEEMTLSLIRYFRYAYANALSFVLLKDEIEHCENYLSLQKLRYRDKLEYSIYMPDYLSDVPVPPLVVQTFAENAVKYAVTSERTTRITIAADFCEVQKTQYLKLIVKDTGPGFSAKQLDALRQDTSLDSPQDRHTGIQNIRRRLALLYQGKAQINFCYDGGAAIEVLLPTTPDLSRYELPVSAASAQH